MNTVTINTRCGEIKGELRPEGVIFQGVPFATAERFEYPVPVTHWDGCFDSTKPPVEFPQFSTFNDDSYRFYTKEFRNGVKFDFAESPLTLNIMAPENARDCPVLIYIHGGGFFTGKMSEHPCGTSMEYAKRGIILVSIGYRLNVFSLYKCKNLCFYDQICAIKWVRDNIADYGGNGSNITLVGQSAGALSIMDLLFSDELDGIIKGAFMCSGAGFFPKFGDGFSPEEAEPFWKLVEKNAGVSCTEELKKVSAEKLWRAWWDAKEHHGSIHLLNPGPDGKIIPEKPSKIKKSGKMLDIPLMVSCTSQDMMVPVIIFKMLVDFCLWSDRRGRKPVYAYYFDRVLPGNAYKAFHSSDLWYLFGNMQYSWRPFTEEDFALRDKMIDSVASFVKTGNPGWDSFTRAHKTLRHFSTCGPDFVKPVSCVPELLKNSIFERGPF